MNPNKDETRSQSVARTAVDGRVFNLVLMYDGEIISALLMITNTLIPVETLNTIKYLQFYLFAVVLMSCLELFL